MKANDTVSILVVDDNEANRDMLTRRLKRESFNVAAAEDGDKALSLVAKSDFDLILLDIMMPGIDGYEVCTRLQKSERTMYIPVIFVTALGDEQNKAKAFAAGGVDYLVKPFDPEVLLSKVNHHLKSGKKWRELPAKSGRAEDRAPRADFLRFREFLIQKLNPEGWKKLKLSKISPAKIYDTAETGVPTAEMAKCVAEFLQVPYQARINPATLELGVLPTTYCQTNRVAPIHNETGAKAFVLCNPFDFQVVDTIKTFPTHRIIIAEPGAFTPLFDPWADANENVPPLAAAAPGDAPAPAASPTSGETSIPGRERLIRIGAPPAADKAAEKPPEAKDLKSLEELEDPGVEILAEYKDETSLSALQSQAGRASVVKLSYFLIANAVDKGASDIHIEPAEKEVNIRFRIDGVLTEQKALDGVLRGPLISRFKIMADMDIAERRVPQDGRVHLGYKGRSIDLRVSSLPVRHGEKIVCRILDKSSLALELDALGFETQPREALRSSFRKHHGILLVTGPTGSGKTTTLYTALRMMNTPQVNIITVEDPVEYEMARINQVQIHPKAGLTFASALRAILRQDPNIVMVGEIRDAETMDIAIRAALTGHLVLSTIHTNDAASTVTRLVEMGLEPFLVGAALEMVAAQRLLRKLCPKCRKPADVPADVRKKFGVEVKDDAQFFQPAGCDACGQTGYKGRVACIEVLAPDDEMKHMIATGAQVEALRAHAIKKCGMVPLKEDAFIKASRGVTSIEEVFRVTA